MNSTQRVLFPFSSRQIGPLEYEATATIYGTSEDVRSESVCYHALDNTGYVTELYITSYIGNTRFEFIILL